VYFAFVMKSILVPTDFSDCAEEAVKMALAIGKRACSHIYFLHLFREQSVVSTIPHAGHYDPIANADEKRADRNLSELVMRAKRSGLEATPVLIHGVDKEEITNYTATCSADLIVMGSHGARGIKDLFMGSNAQYVVRHAAVPAIVVKKIREISEIRNIVFASTFREDMTKPFSRVVDFAKLWNASIDMLFVALNISQIKEQRGESAMLQIADKFPEISFTRNRIDTNDEEWGIQHFVHMYSTDMIAISKNEYSGAFKILSRNIAELLVKHEETPVMVV
jgi:nucleotide-binding universal stress UspA family protein